MVKIPHCCVVHTPATSTNASLNYSPDKPTTHQHVLPRLPFLLCFPFVPGAIRKLLELIGKQDAVIPRVLQESTQPVIVSIPQYMTAAKEKNPMCFSGPYMNDNSINVMLLNNADSVYLRPRVFCKAWHAVCVNTTPRNSLNSRTSRKSLTTPASGTT